MCHRSQDIPKQQLDLKTLLHSNSKLLPLVLFCQCSCLSHSVFFVLVFSDVTARCVRMSMLPAHNFYPWVPQAHHPTHCSIRTLLTSRTRFTLSLHVSLLASQAKINYLDSRSDSLSEFISTRFRRFFLRCKPRVSRTTSHVSVCFNVHRQNVESHAQPLEISRPQFLAA